MNAAGERQCQTGIVPAFTSLMGTDRDKVVLLHALHFYQQVPGQLYDCTGLCCPLGRVLLPHCLLVTLQKDMELLAVVAPEETGKGAKAAQAEVEEVEKAAATGEVESSAGTGLCVKVVIPEGAKETVVEATEKPEAERDAEAFAQAAERIAVSEVAKVLQAAIAELKGKRKSMWIKPRNATQQEDDWVKEGEIFISSRSDDRTKSALLEGVVISAEYMACRFELHNSCEFKVKNPYERVLLLAGLIKGNTKPCGSCFALECKEEIRQTGEGVDLASDGLRPYLAYSGVPAFCKDIAIVCEAGSLMAAMNQQPVDLSKAFLHFNPIDRDYCLEQELREKKKTIPNFAEPQQCEQRKEVLQGRKKL
ncbi:hypothetical protein BTVI_08190 [Pitangus sulphuratus]|nr:hypothetical protein BTVI_08190 [Pitangus sulphuratus]